MKSHLKMLGLAGAIALSLPASVTVAATDTIHGMVISRDGSKLVVRVGGEDKTFMLTDSTKISAIVGPLGGSREKHTASELINGLAVNIDAVPNGDTSDATRITFRPRDLKTAMAVQAGTAQAKDRARAAQQQNEQRFSQVGQFEEKGRLRVYFDTGKAAISAKGSADLRAFARQAAAVPGYVLRVVGHADSTGNAATNQRLSNQRASAVTAYLVRHCDVPPEKIMGSGGLGSTLAVDDGASTGTAEDRRVTVIIAVSKAAER